MERLTSWNDTEATAFAEVRQAVQEALKGFEALINAEEAI